MLGGKKNTKDNQRQVRSTPVPRSQFSYYRSSAGSRSAVSSPRGRGQAAKQPFFKSEWWQVIKRRFGGILLALFLLFCLLAVLQLDRSNPKLKILNPKSNYHLRSDKAYKAAAVAALTSSFANTNKITINGLAVSHSLEQKFPEIGSASVVLPLVGQRPIIYIKLTEPSLIVKTPTQELVVDDQGHALVVAGHGGVSGLDLPVLSDANNLHFKTGSTVLSAQSVNFITSVVDQAAANNIKTKKLLLPAGTEELDFYPNHSGYFVKFNLHDNNVRQQVGSYLAVRGYLKGRNDKPSQYIDVRVPGRAYYK
jgi:hypothetical protein